MRRRMLPFLLAPLAYLAVYPVCFLITGSLMGGDEWRACFPAAGDFHFSLLPRYPTLRSYVELLLDTPEFFAAFWNSARLTAGILAGHLIFGVPAAWGFAKGRFPFRRGLFTFYILLMMMPFQVRMLSDYLLLDALQILDSHMGIILPAAFSTFPVFLMYRFFCGVPDSILEAARLDGASFWQTFFYVGLPLGKAGILSALVLGFLEYWSLIEQPMTFLKTKSLWPLSLYLPNIGLDNAGPAFAASILALLPAMFVFLMGQEELEQGIAAAALKE